MAHSADICKNKITKTGTLKVQRKLNAIFGLLQNTYWLCKSLVLLSLNIQTPKGYFYFCLNWVKYRFIFDYVAADLIHLIQHDFILLYASWSQILHKAITWRSIKGRAATQRKSHRLFLLIWLEHEHTSCAAPLLVEANKLAGEKSTVRASFSFLAAAHWTACEASCRRLFF